LERGGELVDFADQGADVTFHEGSVAGFGIESAVSALARAEGDMDIETPGGLVVNGAWASHRGGDCGWGRNWVWGGGSGLIAVDVLGLEAFPAFDHLELDLFAFVQGFESLAHNCGMVDEDILPCLLHDETEPFFIIEPLDLATGHSCLLLCWGA
jgi:hypothetical protein